jgi:predicted alpha/beta superfamily hydrolase
MKRQILTAIALMSTTIPAAAQGKVVFEGPVYSARFETNRMVRVYLPPSYEEASSPRFPVLYVHDGQNAFTTVGTNVAFGWGNWELDRIVTELSRARRMQEIIIVALDCSEQRYLDYRGPARHYSEAELKELRQSPPSPGDDSRYEKYKRFLIDELKPRIDRDYRTLTDAENTGVMGSSMGGICSLTLAWERSDVFGKAASLSGAFQVEQTNFVANVLRPYRGKAKPLRIYLDSGACDLWGGDDGRAVTEAVAATLRRIGWKDGVDLQHFVDEKPLTTAEFAKAGLRQDKWQEAQKSQHNEFYWRLRAWRPLTFMFPPK